ncbi:MAG: VOC family protein [Vicinamibacteria bacterium]|nr:VOC family protein [Vicinamibacteria bacterium]
MVQAIPDGARTVTPYLTIKGAAKALEFYKAAFGATELMRMPGPGGMVMHAEIRVGDSAVFLSDAFPGNKSPLELKGTPVAMHLYVEDCDAWWQRAVKAGCKVVMPLADQFWGDRFGQVRDPFGHLWSISTHVADPTPEEMEAAMAAMSAPAPKKRAKRRKKAAPPRAKKAVPKKPAKKPAANKKANKPARRR